MSKWRVEVAIDPEWYAIKGVLADRPCPEPTVATWALGAGTTLVGRTSTGRGVHPELPLDDDTGISRRHAEFVVSGEKLFVIDRSSTNGTYVLAPGEGYTGETPPIAPEIARALADGDRVYLGAWTRLTVRLAG
jgi:hypothetical protein